MKKIIFLLGEKNLKHVLFSQDFKRAYSEQKLSIILSKELNHSCFLRLTF